MQDDELFVARVGIIIVFQFLSAALFPAVAIGNCATGRCCSQMVLTGTFPTGKSKNNTEGLQTFLIMLKELE